MSFLRLQRHTIYYASFPIFDISSVVCIFSVFFKTQPCSLPYFAVKRKLYVCLMRYCE